MTMVQKLLWLAEALLKQSGRGQALKRRAVSTAYYAVFHELARLCAGVLLDHEGTLKRTVEYERVYRALDHGSLKAAFNSPALRANPKLSSLGQGIAELQSERVRADYLPAQRLFTEAQCEELLANARFLLELIETLTPEEKRVLAVNLIFKNRSS